MLTHANYLAQAQVLGEMFPITPEDRYFSIIPSNHAIDFMCGYFLSLQFGAAVVHQRTLRPEFIAATMKTYGISHMAVVPLLLKAIEGRIREKLAGLPSWKRLIFSLLKGINAFLTRKRPNPRLSRTLLTSIHEPFGGKIRLLFAGGAFVDPSTAQFLYDLGIPVLIGYGLTEAGTVLTVNDGNPYRSDSVGKPIRSVSLEIRDPNAAGVGEVWVKGPTVMKGYLDDPELTAETIVGGWLRTGDLGTLDPDGHLTLVGRVKNMIVTEGGKNVYPEDVEVAFNDLAGAYEHSVYAANYIWPTKTLTGERLILVLRPKDPGNVDALIPPIRERNGKLADYKRLSGYVIWEREFPRTASLKLKRDLLAKELRESLDRSIALREI
jgi:long-chain acyl-CoA synthetase